MLRNRGAILLVSLSLVLSFTTVRRVTAQSTASSGLSTAEIAAAAQLSEQISTAEWLGPLSAVGLSPFFGIACLSGLAIYGGDYIPGGNALLQSSVLKNEAVFLTFVILAIATSLPRLSKVSKPIAQILDQVEAYAGIITMLVIKGYAMTVASPQEPAEVAMLQAGVIEIGLDGLLMIAAAINIFVVNAVKFFFELLIWITPVPFLDACFEAGNKVCCAVLVGIYAYSPVIATVLNLLILGFCLVLFQRLRRRYLEIRRTYLDPLIAQIWKRIFPPAMENSSPD